MEKIGVEIDHYIALGLPSGEEGALLTEKQISKAYKLKALELHPDKRPDDPNAHDNFQKLKSSYEILKDEKARKLFDELLRVKREQQARRAFHDSKRRRMVEDLEERERSAFAPDPAAKAREDEERIARKLKEEIARIRAKHANKSAAAASVSRERDASGMAADSASRVDKEKILKVSWEKIGEGYSVGRLREIFSKYGEVEDVVMKTLKKRGSALVVMASKDGAVAATQTLSGSISNPLLVVPLQPAVATAFPNTHQSMKEEPDQLDDLVGVGYKAYENSVLEKLKKAAAAQNKK